MKQHEMQDWKVGEFASHVRELAGASGRVIVGISGPRVASSSAAAALCEELGATARCLSVDGFQLARQELRRLGREERRGASDTVDTGGLAAMLRRLKTRDAYPVYAPEFRSEHGESVAGAIRIDQGVTVVVLQGDHQFLDRDGWGEVAELIDEVWHLPVDSDASPSLPPDTGHRAVLIDATERLLDFGEASRVAGGFGWLADDGTVDSRQGVLTRITARATYSYSLAASWGRPGARALAEHGVVSLLESLRDSTGGWRHSLSAVLEDTKTAYDHAFVILAASASLAAGIPRSEELLDSVLEVVLDRFWDDVSGRCVDSLDGRLRRSLPYRGANSSMHMAEAFLAAGYATGDSVWFERASRIIEHFVFEIAVENNWRVPEHYTKHWEIDRHFNDDRPHDKLRPPGTLPGHGLEWARLCLHAAAAGAPMDRAVDAARRLFSRAIEDGWDADRGWLYTVDWSGHPLVPVEPHWVLAEALSASAALHAVTGDADYAVWYGRFWDRAAALFIDRSNGSWRHELDQRNKASALLGLGRPDLYHALQAMLIPRTAWNSSVVAMTLSDG